MAKYHWGLITWPIHGVEADTSTHRITVYREYEGRWGFSFRVILWGLDNVTWSEHLRRSKLIGPTVHTGTLPTVDNKKDAKLAAIAYYEKHLAPKAPEPLIPSGVKRLAAVLRRNAVAKDSNWRIDVTGLTVPGIIRYFTAQGVTLTNEQRETIFAQRTFQLQVDDIHYRVILDRYVTQEQYGKHS